MKKAFLLFLLVGLTMSILSLLPSKKAYAGTFASQFIAKSSNLTLHPGETGTIWVDFMNTGTDTWLWGWPTNEVNLALTDSTYTTSISSSFKFDNNWIRYDIPAAPNYAGVSTNSTARFSFNVTAYETIGTQRLYLRLMKKDGTFLTNNMVFVDVQTVAWPSTSLTATAPSSNQTTLNWTQSTSPSFYAYNLYRFPKYYDSTYTLENYHYIPQKFPNFLVTTITAKTITSYLSTLESEKTYYYILDVVDSAGNVLARSANTEVRNVSNFNVTPQERGLNIYYDQNILSYRNTETFGMGYLESYFQWPGDTGEMLYAMKDMPVTYASSLGTNLAVFLKNSAPRGLPTLKWSDLAGGTGDGQFFIDPQFRLDTGIYLVTGDLSASRLTFYESTYPAESLGSMIFAYAYDGLPAVVLSNPTTRTVTFDKASNQATIQLGKTENGVEVKYTIVIDDGIAEVSGSIKAVSGAVSNPQLIVKTLHSDGLGADVTFPSKKDWSTGTAQQSFLFYDDGKGFVRYEDVAKNNPSRYIGNLVSNNTAIFKYAGSLSSGATWSEYLAKIRYGSQMLGGTADYYQPLSGQDPKLLLGRSVTATYPVYGLAYWCSTNTGDTSTRQVLNDYFTILYTNFTNYTNHAWSSYADKSLGSMNWGELGTYIHGLSMMAQVDSTTTINGLTYGQMAQNIYNAMPSAATGFFATDNDQLATAILGIRHFKGDSDVKADEYETHVTAISAANNFGYFTPKTYMSYKNKNSNNALRALSYGLRLTQWDTKDALIFRPAQGGYAGIGEAQSWGSIMLGDLKARYGGVYPVAILTSNNKANVDVFITALSWNSVSKTLSMTLDTQTKELDVYTGAANLSEVRLNGTLLISGTDYTFDSVTHILRITKTQTAGTNYTLTVKVL